MLKVVFEFFSVTYIIFDLAAVVRLPIPSGYVEGLLRSAKMIKAFLKGYRRQREKIKKMKEEQTKKIVMSIIKGEHKRLIDYLRGQ